jgi:hypothetical protein
MLIFSEKLGTVYFFTNLSITTYSLPYKHSLLQSCSIYYYINQDFIHKKQKNMFKILVQSLKYLRMNFM